MAPKAKAAMRRPAARAAAVVRRPAGAEVPPADPGPRLILGDLGMASLSKLHYIWLRKAKYYHREVDLVGQVESIRVQEGQIRLDLEATGPEDEGLLTLSHFG